MFDMKYIASEPIVCTETLYLESPELTMLLLSVLILSTAAVSRSPISSVCDGTRGLLLL